VNQYIPIQVAFSVLNDAKLKMLQFYYDCVNKYIDPSNFQYIAMDTDSAYMALTDDFDKLIKPEMRAEFEIDKHNWFPRTDTKENSDYDKRTPGLFKIEYEGDGMVSLCSKTYLCWGNKIKFSCKGTQKTQNEELLIKDAYKKCLDNNEFINCTNTGFRYIEKTMKTYEQNKIGLSPIYVKGVVMEDGVHIHPLNI
jgi:hypothetical protein